MFIISVYRSLTFTSLSIAEDRSQIVPKSVISLIKTRFKELITQVSGKDLFSLTCGKTKQCR